MKKGNLTKIFVGVAVALLIVSVVSFQEQVQSMADPKSIRYDKSLTDALSDLSTLLPEDAVLVSSTNAPIVTYLTGHVTKVPYGASSKESLKFYMVRNNYDYLVVFEGKSSVEELKSLFSSGGLKSLEDEFRKIAYYSTDFNKIHVYQLDSQGSEGESQLWENVWQTHTVTHSKIQDFGRPDISTINAIQIRITDDGSGPVSVWLGGLSLVEEYDRETAMVAVNETIITSFQSGHAFRKQSSNGTQVDDTSNFVNGTQSLKLTTDGNGEPLFTRKSSISPTLDFTGKYLKLWIKISDTSKLKEFRVTVTNDNFQSHRNYWIKMPNEV